MKVGKLREKVLSGLVWKFGERIIAQGMSFVVSVILARIMMPEHYGVVAMVTVFINIANVFVTSGFSTALIQKKDADETDFSTIFWCTFVVSILIYGLMFAVAPFVAEFYREQILTEVVRIFSLKIIISAFNSIQHAYVSRHMLFKKFFYSTLFGTLISGFVGILMALSGFGVWALVAQYLTNSIIDTLILGITVPWRPKKKFSMNAAKSLISYGWKILVADLLGTVYNNLRQLLIGRVYTSSDLAFYNKGKQIPELISTNVDTTVSTVLFPAMANEHGNREHVKKMTRKSVLISSYIMFPLMFGLAAVAKPLINVLLTEKWEQAAIYMQVICVAKAIGTVSNANIQSMKAIGRSDIVLKLEVIKKPVGICMILIALKFGVLAIAVSMPLYSIYAAIVNMKPNKQLLDYSISEQLQDYLPATSASLFLMLIVLLMNQLLRASDLLLLIIDIIVGIGIYVVISYLMEFEAFKYLLDFIKDFYIKKIKKQKEER